MKLITKSQHITLGLSGFTALIIGGLITFAPHAFYASSGITLNNDPNLMSEVAQLIWPLV